MGGGIHGADLFHAALDRIKRGATEHDTTSTLPARSPTQASDGRSGAVTQSDSSSHPTNTQVNPRSDGGASATRINEYPKHEQASDKLSTSPPPPAPPPKHRSSTVASREATSAPLNDGADKPPWSRRALAGSKRFVAHTKDAITHSYINVLLIFVPVGIIVNYVPIPHSAKPTIVFAMNAVAIVPLAGLLAFATESVANQLGDTLASLLNVTFGNAVELIIFIIALAKNQIRIVQASILGSILANLLLILGMAFLFGGLRFREQIYNSTVTQMSACLLSLSVTSLILPTAFHASFNDNGEADRATIKISRGTSVVLLLVYMLYLAFQLKSHAYMYESTPQNVIDEESHPGLLADLMNSSSSDDSSSSSDSDSDTSSESRRTATRRIKRAFKHRRHRKSSTSSTVTTSIPSAVSSPTHEAVNAMEDATTSNAGQSQIGNRYNRVSSARDFNNDEKLDEQDECISDMTPRARDFQSGSNPPTSIVRSPTQKSFNVKNKRKKRGKKRDHKRHLEPQNTQSKEVEPHIDDNQPSTAAAEKPKDEPAESNAPRADALSPKRPFAMRQLSRPAFRPPLTSLLSNTVFSTPPPPACAGQSAAMSLAHRTGPRVALRRTSSLPEMTTATRPRTHPGRHESQFRIPDVHSVQRQRPAALIESGILTTDEVEDEEVPQMSRTSAVVLLLCTTALVAFCAELLVDAIPEMVADTSVSEAFIGLIILPIVGNAAEHVTAVTVAVKNKMDLAIGVAVGSSIQIALFVTPFVVVLGWIMDKAMSLYFNLFETVSLFVTTLIVNFLILDGRSNYLEGSLLIAAYVIIAVSAFFYPSSAEQSELGGSENPTQAMAAIRFFF